MGFKYDFDMFSIMPDEVRAEFKDMLDEVGMGEVTSKQIAQFRDPATAEALQNAAPQVKELFLSAGFGLNTYHSGAPEGRYPGIDEQARNACLRRLAEGIAASEGLNEADWGGFNIDDFMDHLTDARPIDTLDFHPNGADTSAPAGKGLLGRIGQMAGGAIAAVSNLRTARSSAER